MIGEYDVGMLGSSGSMRAPKYDKPNGEPEPTREELLARNSFGSPDDNKYLNAPRRAAIAAKERELAELKAGVSK